MIIDNSFDTEYVNEIFEDFVKMCTSREGVRIFVKNRNTSYGIKLNFAINGEKKIISDEYPLLNISNYDDFLSHLTSLFSKLYKKCISDKRYLGMDIQAYSQLLMMSIFVNMSVNDFSAPISYLDRIESSLQYNYSVDLKSCVGELEIKGEKAKVFKQVKRNRIGMETFQHIVFSLKNDKQEEYFFPKIHYYIADNNVYVLGIQKGLEENNDEFSKKVSRYLRKMDKGIKEIHNNENKIENIKDISVNALGALTLFSSYNRNMKKIYMVDYLPLRYMNHINGKKGYEIEQVDIIYRNIVDKFLMTGVRLCEHFDHLECGFNSGILDIDVGNYKSQEGNIIYDLYESIDKHYDNNQEIIKEKSKVK